MTYKTLGSLVVGILLPIFHGQSGHASIVITSVHRGVSVAGVVKSNAGTGDFDTEYLFDFDFGSVYAELVSSVSESQFRVDGSAYEYTDWDGPLNDVEAHIFFAVAFTLDAPSAFTMTGTLAGNSDSEHYVASASLVGPDVDIVYDMWNSFAVIDEAGTLNSGRYSFSVSAHPSVLGGLDGGWAEVYVSSVVLSLVPSVTPGGTQVPEPTTAGIWAILSLIGGAFTRRRLYARC